MARDEDQVRGGLVKFGKRVRAATRAMQAQLHAAFDASLASARF